MVGSKGCQVGSSLGLRVQPFPVNCCSMVSEYEKFNELVWPNCHLKNRLKMAIGLKKTSHWVGGNFYFLFLRIK